MNRQVAQVISETDIDYYKEYAQAIEQHNQTLNDLHHEKERAKELQAELDKERQIKATVAQEYQRRIQTLKEEKEAYRQAHKALEEAYTKKVALP